MRVLMTADTVGGVFTYAVELAEGLRRDGVEVALATFGRRMSRDQRRRVRAAGADVLLESSLGLEWMPDPWDDVRAAEDLLLELERREVPDVVHLNAFAHGAASWRAPAVVVGHSCVCSWWAAVHGQAPPASWSGYRAAVTGGIAGASAVVAPTSAMLGALADWYGPLPRESRVILNGSGYVGATSPTPKRPFVVSAGRLWDEAKNAAALGRAASRPGLRGRVLLVGEISRPAGGYSSAEGATFRDATLLGPLAPAALARVRRTAAVYAAPAQYEPFGLGILEAARDRCALVLGDIPTLRELWDGAAVFVAPGDDEQLGDTLERLLDDSVAAAALGELARSRARRYTLAAMAAGYGDLYRSLTGARRAVAA
ncbi:MAG: glycosyltransferase family 4 protein [Solirubrobacteraceae bacterium]